MKNLETYLKEKGIEMDAFNEMSKDEQLKHINALTKENEKAYKDLVDNTETTKEELLKAQDEKNKVIQKQIDAVVEALSEQTIAMKKMNEKGSKTLDKSDIETFMERVREKKAGFEESTIKAPALMTTANVLPNVASGFNQLFGNYIDPEIYSEPKRDNFILSLVDVATVPGTENIWYVERVNEEGDAEFIGEGDLKPLTDGEWQENKSDIKEVAERWKISERLMNHAPTAVSDFRTHADDLIELKIDDGVLSGDGTGNNLSGITTSASAFVAPTQLANYYTSANIYDVIMACATFVRLNNFKGNLTCVLNTVWKAKMQGIKDADNNYIMPPFVSPDGTQVGEVTMRFENGMSDSDILLGDLKKFKVRFSENIIYAEGWENDDFSKNLQSRKLEAFLGTYLPASNTGAIVFDDIATIQTEIEVV